MVFGLFSKPDYSFYRERMYILVRKAIDKFKRAEAYLDKSNSMYAVSSSKGAINRAYSNLKEAMWNAEKAFELAKNIDEINEVYEIRKHITGGLYGNPIKFKHQHIDEAWNKYAVKPWIKELVGIYTVHEKKFTKVRNEDIENELIKKSQEIVASSILFANTFIDIPTHEQNNIALEAVCLCLSIADRVAVEHLTEDRGREVFGKYLKQEALENFIKIRLNVNDSQAKAWYKGMTEVLKNRLGLYGSCTLLMSEDGGQIPTAGSEAFAFNYFVNRVINSEKVKKFSVEQVLKGKEKVSAENTDAFPELEEMLKWTKRIVTNVSELKLQKFYESIS